MARAARTKKQLPGRSSEALPDRVVRTRDGVPSILPGVEQLYEELAQDVDNGFLSWLQECVARGEQVGSRRLGDCVEIFAGEGTPGERYFSGTIRPIPLEMWATGLPTTRAFVEKHGSVIDVGESKKPGYTGADPPSEAAVRSLLRMRELENRQKDELVTLALAVPSEKRGAAIDFLKTLAAGEVTAHETTARANEPPRLKWETDRLDDESPAHFAWRAYQAEAEAGTLHRGLIGQEDGALAVKLASWLRSPAHREEAKAAGIDIPTLPEWNERQIETIGGTVPSGRRSVRSPQARLYDAARYRAHRP